MGRRRFLIYAALALAVPIPAFALGLGGSTPASLDAHASLDSCGLVGQQIVCKLNVSFNQVAGAESYTASVTAPNGAVADYGAVGAGGGSLWVPYTGDGTYTVTVKAFGSPPSPHQRGSLLSTDRASASGHAKKGGGNVSTNRLHGSPQAASPQGPDSGRSPTDQGTPAQGGQTPDQGESTPPPACVPPTPPDTSGATGSQPGDTGTGTTGTDSTQSGTDASAQAQTQEPQPVTQPQCPDGSVPTDGGTCCPQPTSP